MAFGDHDIVDAELRGQLAEREDAIATIADVAHGHGKSLWIGPRRALQDCLLRPTARAAHAPQLQNANRSVRHANALPVRRGAAHALADRVRTGTQMRWWG